MKKIFIIQAVLLFAFQVSAQSINEQLKEFGVFKEKVVFERINEAELPELSPLVIVDWEYKPIYYKTIDPEKIIRIEKLDKHLAQHLYGKSEAYRLVVDEKTNAEAVFKVVSHPPYPITCPRESSKREKQECTKNYLEKTLKDLVIDQDLFVLEMIIDRTGSITETKVLKGESNVRVNKVLEAWKKEKYMWYPGRQRNNFVSCSLLFEHKK